MAFLVRKLNKVEDILSLNGETDLSKIYADIPTMEFRTKNGTLSTWYINSIDDIENAVMAIAVSSTEISKMDFIVIDTEILEDNSLDFKKTYAGQDIAIPDLQDTHYDILDITIDKLVICTKVYQTIVMQDPECESYIVRYAAGEIKDMLKKAMHEHRVDETKAPKKVKECLDKLKAG